MSTNKGIISNNILHAGTGAYGITVPEGPDILCQSNLNVTDLTKLYNGTTGLVTHYQSIILSNGSLNKFTVDATGSIAAGLGLIKFTVDGITGNTTIAGTLSAGISTLSSIVTNTITGTGTFNISTASGSSIILTSAGSGDVALYTNSKIILRSANNYFDGSDNLYLGNFIYSANGKGISTSGTDLYFTNASTKGLQLNSTAIIPYGTTTLGSSAARWPTIYGVNCDFSGTLGVTGSGTFASSVRIGAVASTIDGGSSGVLSITANSAQLSLSAGTNIQMNCDSSGFIYFGQAATTYYSRVTNGLVVAGGLNLSGSNITNVDAITSNHITVGGAIQIGITAANILDGVSGDIGIYYAAGSKLYLGNSGSYFSAGNLTVGGTINGATISNTYFNSINIATHAHTGGAGGTISINSLSNLNGILTNLVPDTSGVYALGSNVVPAKRWIGFFDYIECSSYVYSDSYIMAKGNISTTTGFFIVTCSPINPLSPTDGYMYFNTISNKLRTYYNLSWHE